jgi:uncharacterized protein YuzE
MEVLYSELTDTLVILNPTGESLSDKHEFKHNTSVDYDIKGKPVMIEIFEASILFGIPKMLLKEFVEVRE